MQDDERPPVLAHRRFQARAAEFEGLPLAARFAEIHASNLWGADTSRSGLGSEAGATDILRRELGELFAALNVRSLLDAPCGDARWIAEADLGPVQYTGVDIVAAQIEENIAERGARGEFLVADITCDPLPVADAILCRDCLVHLSFANIGRAIANFQQSGAKWLIATTFPDFGNNLDCADGDWRALNLERAPFGWPPPVRLLNERCEEAGGGWRDKSLGVWALADLGGAVLTPPRVRRRAVRSA